MTADQQFIECDTCRAKPGSPTLCGGCLHNRRLIEALTGRMTQTRHPLASNPSVTHEYSPESGWQVFCPRCHCEVKTLKSAPHSQDECIRALLEKVTTWEMSCTGKHGSQSLCADRNSPETNEVSNGARLLAIAVGLKIPHPPSWLQLSPHDLQLICEAIARQAGSSSEKATAPLEHVCPSCGRPPGDIEALDALRFRFLTEDIDDRGKREVRNRLLERMAVMSYSAAGRDIDLLIAATTVKTNDIRQAGKEGLEQIREHGPALIDSMMPAKTNEPPFKLCSDCPPVGYATDVTRCSPCPRRNELPVPRPAARLGRAPDCPNPGCDGECYPIQTRNCDCEPQQCEWCFRWRAGESENEQ